MNHITNIPGRYPSKSLRLAARIIGTIWILFLIFLFIGELLEGRTRNSGVVHETPDNFGIAIVICMGIGLAGLVIAWWREGLGGFISLSGFIFAGALLIIAPKLNFSIIFLIVLMPSILYLAYWKDTKKQI